MNLNFESERLLLRPIEDKDVDDITEILSNPAISKYNTNIPYPYTRENALYFIQDSKDKLQKGTYYRFAIVWRESNKMIGMVSLFHVNKTDNNGEVGIWLSKDFWGKGIVSETANLFLEFAFDEMSLNKVYGITVSKNIRAKKVFAKLKFKLVGKLREQAFMDNEYVDVLYFDLLKSEYKH